jgi:beta-glucosidase
MSGNKDLLTGLLKKELNFEGFLISDYNAIDQVNKDFKTAVGISINAGMDMVMAPQRYKEFIADLKALVNEGAVPMSRIDDAVTRILRVKFAMGLMDQKKAPAADRRLWKDFGTAEHREVARQAVRESVVVLKNEGRVLPISKSVARIHVGGKNADDLGNQCGGWTIDWQGKSGDVTSGGTTLLAAIRKTVASGAKVTYSKDGSGAGGATVGVVVIGEKPYAEFDGDRESLALAPEDVAVIRNMKTAGIPVVVVLYSGRPMVLGESLDQANAFVAAWLPGTEGQGVADVLFGDYKPTGKLSFRWQDRFPRGFGLSY